jgi:hypothetical protein
MHFVLEHVDVVVHRPDDRQVVDVHANHQRLACGAPSVDIVLVVAALEVESNEGGVQLGIPSPRHMMKPV